ncbi:6-phosphogluconate dehydrogenase (decarboxylating) [Tremella mesenterica]|uniref:phosphogluconate dehydrogenase (NADP(+)-dependent, decarboxylating) n=1 Tax=Tremella mesenterica TaxID=5217 RepID=A0A4Q1BCF8_TREME|nr:6-phosphogluconate dehydrogenase (decarboxylating) [Tremella mesenterica]
MANIEIGIIGSGSMGSGMTLLFAEHGSTIGCFDTDQKAVQAILDQAKKTETGDDSRVHGFNSLKDLVNAFIKDPNGGHERRIIVLSLPHGKVVDGVCEELLPILDKGDVVVDGGNEWWESTERRQAKAKERGIEWIGMGVSGGYQAARHGPSMSPGGTKEAYDFVEPYLKKWAVKTPEGEPCVCYVGPGGSGHYVKMIHNGIEHAHLSILCEIRAVMAYQFGLSNDEISNYFEKWYRSGPLRGNYLIGIGYKGLRFKKGGGIEDKRGIVEDVEDKVTQDVDLSEGTGTWSTMEIATRHVAAPAIAASHQLRIISSDKSERLEVVKNMSLPQPREDKLGKGVKEDVMKSVEKAVYGCILGGFVQGLAIIAKASQEQKWDISLAETMKIWRAGCIIQSDGICDLLLPHLTKFPPSEPHNLLQSIPEVAKELASTYAAVKEVYMLAVAADAVAPAVGATLEWMKSVSGKNLPTDFEEMELDYFGHHNYDIKGHPEPGHSKGKYHTVFAPA